MILLDANLLIHYLKGDARIAAAIRGTDRNDAAMAAARVRVGLEKRGLIIGPLDLPIAGTAMSRRATLATRNVDEFSRVDGLQIIDWTSE